MAYDNSSLTGDEICDYYYDIENNFMNPPSPTGYFIYTVLGGAFDRIAELVNQFRIDYSILDCNVGKIEINKFPEEPNLTHTYYVPLYDEEGNKYIKYQFVDGVWVETALHTKVLNSLDTFWGRSYNLERPSISYTIDGVTFSRALTDDEYKIYLYLRNHRLLTQKDVLVAFGNCFGDVQVGQQTIASIRAVNHKMYDNPPFTNETLAAYDPNDTGIVIDTKHTGVDSDPVIDKKTTTSTLTITIPEGYDENFLTLLAEYASIKGNVLISMED